jgi:hypothetical protein
MHGALGNFPGMPPARGVFGKLLASVYPAETLPPTTNRPTNLAHLAGRGPLF